MTLSGIRWIIIAIQITLLIIQIIHSSITPLGKKAKISFRYAIAICALCLINFILVVVEKC